ncbi:SigE family RNA polymerase sigma factor [Nocardioides sp. GY 10113]|uniref:SigE family RNA polymerase sigma factor n=1 Tax=Nocardioides sp. GY 10113 TaxID=2569761 RepID=UPI0010A7B2CA|nr:SigE family RNA polymerase sigma factor [Nocardioides sp. GY 10113]TIC80454.1 SigE family RNA polymerase sigma factor [Nocardioides sp. GY 10113]
MKRPSMEAEFEEYFLARGPTLRRTAYLVVRDWHVADDVTQAAMTKLYLAWPRLRVETIDAYARRTVVNEAISTARRGRREWPTSDLPEAGAPEPPDVGFDVGRALDLLSPQQRAIVALRFFEDHSVAAVADALGIAEGTVKSQTSRAISTLRAHLHDLVPTEELS